MTFCAVCYNFTLDLAFLQRTFSPIPGKHIIRLFNYLILGNSPIVGYSLSDSVFWESCIYSLSSGESPSVFWSKLISGISVIFIIPDSDSPALYSVLITYF